MDTKMLRKDDVELAAKLLRDEEIIAFPTETVYGLACIASSKKAFERLVAVKKRPADKPFTLMCSDITMAVQYAEINNGIAHVMKRFLPGEVTLLLKARKGIPSWITLGTNVIGIRVPNDDFARTLIERVGKPLLVPSANISNSEPLCYGKDVFSQFNGEIAAVIEGESLGKVPSTIVDLRSEKPVLVRQGNVPFDMIVDEFMLPKTMVVLGSDHGGFKAKEEIKRHLLDRGYLVMDVGPLKEERCDYPDFAYVACEEVVAHDCFGVLVCTSGEGIAMAANRNPMIRCGIGYDDVAVGKTRDHNDANMIAFGQKYMSMKDILRRVDIFLCENFSFGENHIRRVLKLSNPK